MTDSKKLVSVVIPTYQRPKLVERAVNSVLNQTYQNIEIIVVNDDPETDLSHIKSMSDKVTLLNHEENKGACQARNTGIKQAEGDYIGLLDDDDEYLPEKIEKQIQQFEQLPKEYGMVYSGVEEVKNGETVNTKTRPGRKFLSRKREGKVYQELLRGNMIPAPTVLVKKECFDKVGLFDPEFESSQDLDMWLRIAQKHKIGKLDEALAKYHLDGEDRISESLEKKIQGKSKILEKYLEDINKNPQARLAVKTELETYKLQKKLDNPITDKIISKIRLLGLALSRIG
jgi:glycosyltransferase involved in cell wall biosynthesis